MAGCRGKHAEVALEWDRWLIDWLDRLKSLAHYANKESLSFETEPRPLRWHIARHQYPGDENESRQIFSTARSASAWANVTIRSRCDTPIRSTRS